MIMNEDKIEEAANKYALNRIDDSYKSYSEHRQLSASTFSGEDVSEAFLEGAKYALSNQWHDAKKELPQEGQRVFTCYKGLYLHCLYENKLFVIIDGYPCGTGADGRIIYSSESIDPKMEVEFWMTIPSLPEKLK